MKKVVFITSRFPYPLDKGDKLRAFHQIKDLSGYADVHLISISEEEPSPSDFQALSSYCSSIDNFVLSKPKRLLRVFGAVFSNQPFSVSYFFNPTIKKAIAQRIRAIQPEVIHCHLIRTAPYLPQETTARTSIDFMDCFSLGALKERNATQNPLRKLFLQQEYRRLLRAEREAFQNFNIHYVIAGPDRDALSVEDSSRIQILPNGVDFNTFYPSQPEYEKKFALLFSGHMGYKPNISAARFAAEKIIPEVSEDYNLLIAGIGITQEIAKFRSEQIHVETEFPHIREAFWQSKILLAPMMISIGLQNKILQAMAMKIPVVCTPQANLSINAPHGVAICTASAPHEFKAAIDRLMHDHTFYEQLAEEGYVFVKANFDWAHIHAGFAQTLLEL